MRTQVLVATVLLSAAGCLPAQTQPSSAAAAAKAGGGSFVMARMPDGHPDLQGTYDLATLTPVERPRGQGPSMSKEQAEKLMTAQAAYSRKEDEKIDGNRSAPPKGGDGTKGAYGNVGGYNYGWLDPGSTYFMVDGQYRTSIIVDPADGRTPPFTAAAQQRMAAMRDLPQSNTTETNDPGLEKTPGAYDDPERRPLGERCLLGFGSTSGPPMLPDYFYNNLHKIVQTPDSVMILSEMVHDARIVRMNARHLPPTIRKWMGDSVGRWEGDTLVVDTTNFTDKTRFYGATKDLHVVERFTRTGPNTLRYRFTIEDPNTWTRPWSGEMTWPETKGLIYEYACHEANYALGDILRGAREREREQAAASVSGK